MGECYEPEVFWTIKKFIDAGYQDFFVDIGANIGLSTLEVGAFFKNIFCFEPNNLLVPILDANLQIAGLRDKTTVFNYGLGSQTGEFELNIPKDNFGGAFINCMDNQYSESLLARKDNLKSIHDGYHLVQRVFIESAFEVMSLIFEKLLSSKSISGCLKLDVEGMERSIIAEIARALPTDMKAVFIFENHDPEFPMSELIGHFKREVRVFRVDQRLPFKPSSPILWKGLRSLFGESQITLIPDAIMGTKVGTLVLLLE